MAAAVRDVAVDASESVDVVEVVVEPKARITMWGQLDALAAVKRSLKIFTSELRISSASTCLRVAFLSVEHVTPVRVQQLTCECMHPVAARLPWPSVRGWRLCRSCGCRSRRCRGCCCWF